MPARLNNRHQSMVREKIKTSQLLNRLTDHALGKNEMTATQVTAALGVLRKILPDLAVTELNVDGEIRNRDITDEPLTEEQWSERYSAAH